MAFTYDNTQWPCRIKYDWRPPRQNLDSEMQVHANEDAWLLTQRSDGWSRISICSSDKMGWVPTWNIEKGSVTANTPTKVNLIANIPTFSSAILSFPPTASSSPFARAIHGLLQGWKVTLQTSNSLRFIDSEVQNILTNDSTLAHFEQSLIKDISPSFMKFLNGDITFDALEQCQGIARMAGIYARLYRLPNGTNYIYVGSSLDMTHRQQRHTTEIKNRKTNQHYVIARQAYKTTVILLAKISSENYMLLSEQCFITLFGSYTPFMIEPPVSHTSTDYSRWATAVWETVTLWRTSLESFNQTGWTPLGQKLGISGCNVASPIIGSGISRTLWTRVIQPDRCIAEFRRSPMQPSEYRPLTSSTAILNAFGTSRFAALTLPPKGLPGLQPDAVVGIAMELKIDGEPHAAPYCRLPPNGRYTDWRDISFLAVRLEWQTPNGWRAIYLQRKNVLGKSLEPPSSYKAASAMVAAFRRQIYQST